MKANALSQFIILYDWFLLVGLLIFLMLIARFYEHFSGEKTYYQLFLVPMMLFGVDVVRRANYHNDPAGSVFAGLAGLVLIGLSAFLYRRMTTGRG